MSYANITVVGRLARDPEIKMTQTGKQSVTASVSVGPRDKSQWFKINAWEKTGEWLKDARKGDMVFAQGTLQLGTYEKKTGGAAVDAVVNAQIIRTSHKREAIDEVFGAGPAQGQAQADFDLDSDIPF